MPVHEADHYSDGVISTDVLRSYVYCRYKAYLKLSSQVGIQSAYEAALTELTDAELADLVELRGGAR